MRAVGLYALPSLVAGYFAATADEPSVSQRLAMVGLPWLTIVLGAAVLMVVVGRHGQGRRVDVGRATWQGLRWVPRYVWTNCHTTVLFWGPVGSMLLLRTWQETSHPVDGLPGAILAAGWWLAIGALALYIHCRTLLAPFLAVHADLPGTIATIEAWRLSGRHLAICVGTFIFGSLPVAVPFLAAVGLAALLIDAPTQARLARAVPDLAWVGVHAVRPVLVPALYTLYKELWYSGPTGTGDVPPIGRWLLALTRQMPHFGSWA